MGDSWKSRSECGPELPQDFGGDTDHGSAKLAKMVQDAPSYTHGKFLDDADYKVDRKNVSQEIPKIHEDPSKRNGEI